MPLDRITLSSYNCRGFNTPEKRNQILYHFHKAKSKNLLLQETHFRSSAIPTLNNPHYHQWYHSTNPQSKSKGVSIAFHKSFHPQVLDYLVDPLGRYLFLKLKSNSSIFTVANIYGPNLDQGNFLAGVLEKLLFWRSPFHPRWRPQCSSFSVRGHILR